MGLKSFLVIGATAYSLLVTQLIAAETLTVVIQGIEKDQGTIMVQIMAGENEFKGEDPSIASVMQRAKIGEMQFSTSNLPAGDYAIRVMHDVDGNGELNANFVGMPTEPWAMSNNAKGNFGPPKWKDVSFAVQGETTQVLKLSK